MIPARVLEKTRVEPSGCWVWTGYTMKNGYGLSSLASKKILAHRLTYQCTKGEIPEGLQIDHLCRNRACVNPDHLEAVTPAENYLRGEHPRHKTAATKICQRGHQIVGRNAYRGHACATCRRAATDRYQARKKLEMNRPFDEASTS